MGMLPHVSVCLIRRPDMDNTIISVRNLKKYFPTSSGTLHAVDDVSFDIERGTTLGAVGESGCGKSTLGRVLLHLLPSTDGQIIFEGKDITNVSRHELHELRKSGRSCLQCSVVYGHRSQKAHPLGRFVGSGIMPLMGSNRSVSTSNLGRELNRPIV